MEKYFEGFVRVLLCGCHAYAVYGLKAHPPELLVTVAVVDRPYTFITAVQVLEHRERRSVGQMLGVPLVGEVRVTDEHSWANEAKLNGEYIAIFLNELLHADVRLPVNMVKTI